MGSASALSSVDRAIASKAIGRRFKSGNTHRKETQRRVPARTENGLRPKSQDNSAVLKPQADGPWQNVARLGSAHQEPARLTVSELPNRYAQRVNRHTLKKAVMVIYFRAGLRRADVDK